MPVFSVAKHFFSKGTVEPKRWTNVALGRPTLLLFATLLGVKLALGNSCIPLCQLLLEKCFLFLKYES